MTHATQSDRSDATTQWRVFAGIGVFIAVIGVVYWFVSYEVAGTTMLALSSALALFCASYLWRQDVRLAATGEAPTEAGGAVRDDPDHEPYLPTSSIWPFAIGISAALAVNGLILGWPYAMPGAGLLALAIAGWVAESRRRG